MCFGTNGCYRGNKNFMGRNEGTSSKKVTKGVDSYNGLWNFFEW